MTKTGWVLKLGDRPAEERNFEGVDGLGAGTDNRNFAGGNFIRRSSQDLEDKCWHQRAKGTKQKVSNGEQGKEAEMEGRMESSG